MLGSNVGSGEILGLIQNKTRVNLSNVNSLEAKRNKLLGIFIII